MLLDSWITYQVIQERVKDRIREAERERLIRLANSARPGLLDPVLASIGGLLISVGKKLQRRHAPVQTGLTGSPSPATQ